MEKTENTNVPETNPNFYDENNPYYGVFADCFSRKQLITNKKFQELQYEINSGDIEATISLALGFLQKSDKVRRSEGGLVCMPSIIKYGREYHNPNYPDFDTRYYFALQLACKNACAFKVNGRFYSNKLIATALMEVLKYWVYTRGMKGYWLSEVNEFDECGYTDQYQLINEMFNVNNSWISNPYDCAKLLIELIEEYGTDIISDVHKERTVDDIRYLVYAHVYYSVETLPAKSKIFYFTEKNSKKLVYCSEHFGVPITKEILEEYCDNDIKKKIFNFIVKQTDDEKARLGIVPNNSREATGNTYSENVKIVKPIKKNALNKSTKKEQKTKESSRYESVSENILNAEEQIKKNVMNGAAFFLRSSLESFVKIKCREINIPTSDDDKSVGLEMMIGSISDNHLISNDEKNFFHDIRAISNKGVHTTTNEAENDSIKSHCRSWKHYLINNGYYVEPNKKDVYAPISGFYFYNKDKRTYGMWSECQSREDLLTIPEYVELKKKADLGDVDAMIDIALGFLDKKGGIRTSDFGLMCMPKTKKYGKYFFNETNRDYNALYYHWINLAAKTACEKNSEGEFYSKRLIATALLESIKYNFVKVGTEYVYVYDVDSKRIKNTEEYEYFLKYRDQNELACEMFGVERICYANIYSASRLLLSLIEEYGNEIIAPMHDERDISTIRYIVYAYIYYCCSVYPNEYQNYILKESTSKILLISDDDAEQIVTQETLQKYNDTELKNKVYEYVVENTKIKVLERRGFDDSGYSLLDLINMADDNYGAAKELYKQRKKVGFESVEKEIESLEKVCSFSSATAEDYENLALIYFGRAASRMFGYEDKLINTCEKAISLESLRAKRILLNYYSMYVDCGELAFQVSESLAADGDILDKYCHYIMLYSWLFRNQPNIQLLQKAWREELFKSDEINSYPVLADFAKQISPDKLKDLFDYVHSLTEPSREAYAVLLSLAIFDGNRNSQLLLNEANKLKLVNANDFQYSAYIYNLLYNRRFYRNNLATTGGNVLESLSEGFSNYVQNKASENTIRGVLYSGLSDFLKNI